MKLLITHFFKVYNINIKFCMWETLKHGICIGGESEY